MSEDLVDVYETDNLADAQLLVARLEENGIDSFIDNSDSPFDGLTTAQQQKIVRVLPDKETDARKVVDEYVSERDSSADEEDDDEEA